MENRRLLGLVLALGIVAGAAGAFVMTRAGTSAQGAQAAVEASPAVEAQHTDVPLEPVATAAPKPPGYSASSRTPARRHDTFAPAGILSCRRHSSASHR